MSQGTITTTSTGSVGETLVLTDSFEPASMSKDLLVIPQKTDATLTFTLNINEESKTITKNIAIDWKPGAKYTYNITLDPYEIVIKATEWENININQNITIG